jgi:RNA polymerase sigma factor (sigma-70 family)
MNTTSSSLLDRLKRARPDAAEWHLLQDIYLPLVRSWLARVPGLGAEADDLAQEALVVLFRELPSFERRRHGSFRAWLRQITVNRLRAFVRARHKRPRAGLGPEGEQLLAQLEDPASTKQVGRDGCADCRKVVAAQSGDDFLDRLRAAHGLSGTPMPDKALSGVSRSVGPQGPGATSQTPVPNLPPELARHPDYEVLKELGHGGMGVVYLARHRMSGRREVLKVMNKEMLRRPGSKERFLREIRNADHLAKLHGRLRLARPTCFV